MSKLLKANRRDNKRRKARQGMKVVGRSLLTVIAPIRKKKYHQARKELADKKG